MEVGTLGASGGLEGTLGPATKQNKGISALRNKPQENNEGDEKYQERREPSGTLARLNLHIWAVE
jgi:hypothetical protein